MSATRTVAIEPSRVATTELELQPHDGRHGEAPPPASDASAAAVDREPALPYAKILVAGFSFFCAGANDGTLGPLIPYILATFGIGTGEVAIIYGTTFAGWLLAAATNPVLTAHWTLGQLLAAGAVLQLAAQCLRPWCGFPLFGITFFLQALGMAYQDSHANTFVSGVPNVPHRWLGFIHACYALGCFVGPLIATAMATTSSSSSSSPSSLGKEEAAFEGWRQVYFVLIGLGVSNVAGVAFAFGDSLWSTTRGGDMAPGPGPGRRGRNKLAFQEMASLLGGKTIWIISLFYFFELGAWFTASGWVVEFLTTVRGGALSQMGYVPTGYYGGLLLGRLLLAEPTFRWGERRMLLVYSAICIALQLVFWLQPNIVASAVMLSLMGFFFGPFFATGMSVASKLFPKKSQPAALGFIFVLAQAGAALFPSLTGLIATNAGVAVLQPIVLALIVLGAICWYLVPKVPARDV